MRRLEEMVLNFALSDVDVQVSLPIGSVATYLRFASQCKFIAKHDFSLLSSLFRIRRCPTNQDHFTTRDSSPRGTRPQHFKPSLPTWSPQTTTRCSSKLLTSPLVVAVEVEPGRTTSTVSLGGDEEVDQVPCPVIVPPMTSVTRATAFSHIRATAHSSPNRNSHNNSTTITTTVAATG